MGENWKDKANCLGSDTESFFTQSNNETYYHNKAMLIKICSACEVKAECLDYAIKHEMLGWWAGTTEQQRMIMVGKRQPVLRKRKAV
jgi:WhiB family transcriptional regulator, redox-sensing transcriptional regulator